MSNFFLLCSVTLVMALITRQGVIIVIFSSRHALVAMTSTSVVSIAQVSSAGSRCHLMFDGDCVDFQLVQRGVVSSAEAARMHRLVVW